MSLEIDLDSGACDFDADSAPSLPECSLTVQLNAAAISAAVPAALAQMVATGATAGVPPAPVWSQILRVRLQPQGPAPTAWPEVSFQRRGGYHLDVVTFHFETAVVPSLSAQRGGPPASPQCATCLPPRFLQVEVRLFMHRTDTARFCATVFQRSVPKGCAILCLSSS